MILADTSAWVWSRRQAYPELRSFFDSLLLGGQIATCDVVKLELLYGARSDEFDQRREELDQLDACPIGPDQLRRAIDLAGALAHATPDGHKSVRWPDLVIAAAAEAARAELLHYDDDYERIGELTGQPIRWLAQKGTLR